MSPKRSWLLTSQLVAFTLVLQAGELRFSPLQRSGQTSLTNTFPQGAVVLEKAPSSDGPWAPHKNLFTTNHTTPVVLPIEPGSEASAFYRAVAFDFTPRIPNGRPGFTNVTKVYGLLTTLAGAGGSPAAVNKWLPEFEGGPATNALLSRPHIAMADDAGNIYIADKDAHSIRKVDTNGIITTVAGINTPGIGTDIPSPAEEVPLYEPNGLWVQGDGTLYILDLVGSRIRRRDTEGILTTVVVDPDLIRIGRGLWVNEDGSELYYASGSRILRWSEAEGLSPLATGFVELGNIHRHPFTGELVATDRGGHRVYRIESDGVKVPIAGTGATTGGGDAQEALESGLNEVRGVWFLPTGAYFLATHRGSQVWYVDTDGILHLFLNGATSDTHAGDGTWFFDPAQYRVSEVRAVTVDKQGHVLITEHDAGYIRKVAFLPVVE